MYSFPSSCTFAALTMASAASTAPTNPLVSTIPSASRGISLSSLLSVVDIKSDLIGSLLPPTYHRGRQEARDADLLGYKSLTPFSSASYSAEKVGVVRSSYKRRADRPGVTIRPTDTRNRASGDGSEYRRTIAT